MNRSRAIILENYPEAQRIAASSARISTQQGNAIQIYEKSGDTEKDVKLIKKVMSSGHRSVIEHQMFSIAFNDVSVFAEQFMIEFRLASYTVKSRRYVNFSDAGYVVPDDMNDDVKRIYMDSTAELFGVYDRLIELGIPMEDARFVLPYGFRSNFFVTVNARELMHMIEAMLYGRGSANSELRSIGHQLLSQFQTLYPDIVTAAKANRSCENSIKKEFCNVCDCEPSVELIIQPQNAKAILERAMEFSAISGSYAELMASERPRELENLTYGFEIRGVSLACLTHFTRHRMLSLQIKDQIFALTRGNYVMPQSIKENLEAEMVYREAFRKQKIAAETAVQHGIGDNLVYMAMAGHTTDILLTANARELSHFAKLRTCNRAQWEIRAIAREMLKKLRKTELKDLFRLFGPSCAVTGKCPEGKMTCGKPYKIDTAE